MKIHPLTALIDQALREGRFVYQEFPTHVALKVKNATTGVVTTIAEIDQVDLPKVLAAYEVA